MTYKPVIIIAFLISSFSQTQAQNDKLKIAVVSSLYIDTLYQDKEFKVLNVAEYEDYLKLGWDFYLGFRNALDSLKTNSFIAKSVEFYYHDIKKIILNADTQSLSTTFKDNEYNLIFGIPLRDEMSIIAKYANANKIPFISALYPNIINETLYPYHILLNPLFSTHITEMIKFMYKTNKRNKIRVIIKASEDNNIILDEIAKLRSSYWASKDIIEIVSLYDSFYVYKTDILKLTPNETNNLFVLSLDKSFTERLWKQLANHYKPNVYSFFIGGMPTLEQHKTIDTLKIPNITFCYSKAFYYNEKKAEMINMSEIYTNSFNNTLSDMYWLGYETAMTFTKKLVANPWNKSFLKSLNDTTHRTFTNFNFFTKTMPINSNTNFEEFIENQHLFFIQTNNGKKIISEN